MFNDNNRLPDGILVRLNANAKKTITHEDIVVSAPINTSPTGGTTVWIKGRKSSNFIGTVPINYHRLLLSDMFYGIDITLNLNQVFNTDQVLPLLRQAYGIELTDTDIVISPVDFTEVKEVTLVASDSSYLYCGSITIRHSEPLESLFDINQIELDLDSSTDTNTNAMAYSWQYSFTSLSFVETINESNFVDHLDLLSIALSEETKDTWVFADELSDFNVQGATFTYNGPIATDLERPQTHVLKMRLSKEYCQNLSGEIHMFYIPVKDIETID